MADNATADKTYTPAELRAQAHQEVGAEVAGEASPYQSDIGGAKSDMAAGLGTLDKMFGNLLPYVQGSAQRVRSSYDQSIAQERSIFATAAARLGQIRGQRAAEAQAMAQQVGGPVNVDDFLSPLNTSMTEMPHAEAGSMLHALGLSQLGVTEAEAFAGKVFPLLQTEQAAQIRNQFQARINAAQAEIDRIKASAPGRETTRLNDLLVREREYTLQKQQAALDRLKADRDWRLANLQLQQQKVQNANDRANLLGYYDKPLYRDKKGILHTQRIYTLGGRQLQEQTRSSMASETISAAEVTAKKVAADKAYAVNAAAIATDQRTAAAKYIDAVMSPGTQTITKTQWDAVPDDVAAGMDKTKLVARMVDGKRVWFKATTVTEPINTPVIENPTEIYRFLVAHNIPPAIAKDMVKKRFNLTPNWTPGMKYAAGRLDPATVNKMDFPTLRREARRRGWKPDPNHPAMAVDLREWLLKYQGKSPGGASGGITPSPDVTAKALGIPPKAPAKTPAKPAPRQQTIPAGRESKNTGTPVVLTKNPATLDPPPPGMHWVRVGPGRYQLQNARGQ